MRRRDFITLVAGAASWPLVAQAQRVREPAINIGLLFERLVKLAGEQRNICFLTGSNGTATVFGLWRIRRLVALGFN